MRIRTLFPHALGCVAVSCLAFGAMAADPRPLFAPAPDTAAKRAASDSVHAALASDRAVASIALVQADATRIDEGTEALQIDLAPDTRLQVRQQYAYRNADGTTVWAGLSEDPRTTAARLRRFGDAEIADAPEDSVLIVRNGDRLTGTIRSGGRLYRISPLRDGGHAVSRIDETRMPADHPADYDLRAIELPSPGHMETGDVGDKANTVVRVGVLVTRSAVNAIGDVTGFAQLAVAESNQGFANSHVAVTLQLAGIRTTDYRSAGFTTDLFRFASPYDGQIDGWHGARDRLHADVNVMIVNNSSSCGAGYINASAFTAFSVVHHGCATGYYSFAHEIGHNFGTHHNPQAPASNSNYAYGHGYLGPGAAWRTVMSYSCGSGCPRINYWSNPNRTYRGAAMGTTSTHNNGRVLNKRRGTVAGFR